MSKINIKSKVIVAKKVKKTLKEGFIKESMLLQEGGGWGEAVSGPIHSYQF